MTDDGWREALDVKVVAQIRMAREAFKAMKPQGSGAILFMAGTHGRQPRTYSVTAGVTNAALINASKVLAEAGAPFNIRVNAINPGPIDTDRMVYLVKEKATELGISEVEAKRILADVTAPAQALRRAARARRPCRGLPRLGPRQLPPPAPWSISTAARCRRSDMVEVTTPSSPCDGGGRVVQA